MDLMDPNDASLERQPLLDAFTIEEVIAKLSSIDEKINELQACSSEDFMNFTAQMKRYHKENRQISSDADSIVKIISGKEYSDLNETLKLFYAQARKLVEVFEQQVSRSTHALESILTRLSLMFVPLKNFRQNLMTLKFLQSNLHLKASLSLEEEPMREADEQLAALFIELDRVFPKLHDTLNGLRLAFSQSLGRLRELREVNVVSLETILFQVHSAINLINIKYEEALKHIPLLAQKAENYSQNINKIIIKIQYHDIIRQKMEHIQKIHHDLVSELRQIAVQPDDTTERQMQLYLRIRDVAALQVAQLIHTNKDYENAIDIIAKKMIAIGDDMNEIGNLCYQLTSHTYETEQTHFKEVQDKLDDAMEIVLEFIQANGKLKAEVEAIDMAIEHLDKQLPAVEQVAKGFGKYLALVEKLLEAQRVEPGTSRIFQQIKGLCKDVETTNLKIKLLGSQIYAIDQGQKKDMADYQARVDLSKEDNMLKKSIDSVLNNLMTSNATAFEMLERTSKAASAIFDETRNCVQQVRYYDLFEKVIEKIILELNDINMRLEAKQRGTRAERVENLAALERIYTVHSERLIHERMTQEDPPTADDLELNPEDDGELELF